MGWTLETYTDKSGEYRWRLKAANGEIVAHGESYKQKATRDEMVRKIVSHMADATIVEAKN